MKTKENDNGLNLLKRGVLLKLIRQEGISRISSDALGLLDAKISEDVVCLIRRLRQHVQVRARKTVGADDVDEVLG